MGRLAKWGGRTRREHRGLSSEMVLLQGRNALHVSQRDAVGLLVILALATLVVVQHQDLRSARTLLLDERKHRERANHDEARASGGAPQAMVARAC